MLLFNRNKIRLIICAIFLIILIVIGVYCYPVFKLFYILKTYYSDDKTPWAYIMPMTKELEENKLSEDEYFIIDFEGLKLRIPNKETSRQAEPLIGEIVKIKSHDNKFLLISKDLKDGYMLSKNIIENFPNEFRSFIESKHGGSFSDYELIKFVLSTTPDQGGFRGSFEEIGFKIPLLMLKSTIIINAEKVLLFEKEHIKFIQFGGAGSNRLVSVAIYKNGASPSVIKFNSFSQEEIEQILSNVEKN